MTVPSILKNMIIATDQKIDLMEHILEKMNAMKFSEQRAFIGSSPIFEKLDLLNRTFLREYRQLLRTLGTTEITEEHAAEYPAIKDLQNLVVYAMTLEEQMDELLGKHMTEGRLTTATR